MPVASRMRDVAAATYAIQISGSGSGKSVLLKTIIGLNEAREGRIEMLGVDTRTLQGKAKREMLARTGVQFQDGALFSSLSVTENIIVPIREHAGLEEVALLGAEHPGDHQRPRSPRQVVHVHPVAHADRRPVAAQLELEPERRRLQERQPLEHHVALLEVGLEALAGKILDGQDGDAVGVGIDRRAEVELGRAQEHAVVVDVRTRIGTAGTTELDELARRQRQVETTTAPLRAQLAQRGPAQRPCSRRQ